MSKHYRIQAFVAHPDDETYPMAGTLASLASAGCAVQVVCATRGEAGQRRDRQDIEPQAMGMLRWQELQNSCEALGLMPPVCLGLPDGRLDTCDEGKDLVGAQLTQFSPHVVITLADDGAYGHKDHLAVTQWVSHAVMADPRVGQLRLFYATFPKGVFNTLHRRLRKAPNSPIDPAIRAEMLGTPVNKMDITIDITPWRQHKLNAMGSHGSQLLDGNPMTFLIPKVVEQVLVQEYFLLRSGPTLPPNARDLISGLMA